VAILEAIRSALTALPVLAKFAAGVVLVLLVPRIAKRYRLPPEVGLILSGVLFGPHVLDLFGEHRPIVEFFGDLGKLLLMFFAGLEIDLALFRKTRVRSAAFGILTTALPLLLGATVGLWLGYALVPAIVIGSLLASHTLLGNAVVRRLGATNLEPVTITVGATVLSDTLSLVVFAICVSTFVSGFSVSALAVQLVEIAVFVPLVLVGLSRLGVRVLKTVEDEEDTYFLFVLGMLAASALLAQLVNLPGIVGAFLAGLAVNAAVRQKPATDKLEFFGRSLFIPVFFIGTGFYIDPPLFLQSVIDNFPSVFGIIAALLVGKWIAAQVAGGLFHYSWAARITMWSLTLPQVAATLAATLVAFHTLNPAGERLLDVRMLNVVLVLMLTTSIVGPLLTQRFVPRLLEEQPENRPSSRVEAHS
jgi:Kef-type K+ transport system membrane component KefB